MANYHKTKKRIVDNNNKIGKKFKIDTELASGNEKLDKKQNNNKKYSTMNKTSSRHAKSNKKKKSNLFVVTEKISKTLTQTQKLKSTLNIKKLWFWEILNKSLLRSSYGSEFLLGGSSENTNKSYRSNFLMSKNNIEIFNIFPVRVRLIALYASFKWLKSAHMHGIFYKNFKLMFASHTPVFSNLMAWAGLVTGGVSSGNRWLPGRISAQTNLKFLPNYLFVPDPDENFMILKEAWYKKIPVISINSSDSKFTADLGIYGNNKSFKLIFKLLQLIIRLSKNQNKCSVLSLQKNKTKNKKWFVLASKKL